MKYVALAGRILYAWLFITSALGHFSKAAVEYAASQGVPMASALVPISGIIALFGGLSVMVGYKARFGAWLLVIFLVPVTCLMHDFWSVHDPMAARMQQIMFLKNLSLLGAALLITYVGAGPLSIDAARAAEPA